MVLSVLGRGAALPHPYPNNFEFGLQQGIIPERRDLSVFFAVAIDAHLHFFDGCQHATFHLSLGET